MYYQQPNYDNQLVQTIKEQLGDFNYNPMPQNRENIRRERRAVVTLENSARYEGEWDIQANLRDG